LGDVWLQLNDRPRARQAFEQSLPLLERAGEKEELIKAQHGYAAASQSSPDSSANHPSGGTNHVE
jgi:hypothetical protein